MQVTIDRNPYPQNVFSRHQLDDFWGRGSWPAHWIGGETNDDAPQVWAFRCNFTVEAARTIRVSVTADERYILFLDGKLVGRGSERGNLDNWYYETYDLKLSAGEHVLVAQVWALKNKAPAAQFSVQNGFLLAPHDEELLPLLATGVADWQVKTLRGIEFLPAAIGNTFLAAQVNLQIDASLFDWGFERGEGEDWHVANKLSSAKSADSTFIVNNKSHLLKPGILPPQMSEIRHVGTVRHVANIETLDTRAVAVRESDNIESQNESWNVLLRGEKNIEIAPHSRLRVLVDLENYYCAYPKIAVSGGRESTVRIAWEEALYDAAENGAKGNRNQIEGKYFRGLRDEFLPDGEDNRAFTTLWWQCGRYVEIVVETGDEPLVIESFALRETRYPLEMESAFACDDDRVLDTIAPMLRGLQMCAHETFMDCPYYEQLQYIGDTRLEILTTYAISRDDRLPRKALRMFDASRLPNGLTQSRYPSRERQTIPTFSLWYVNTLYDFLMYRNDLDFVRELAPGAREVLDAFRGFCNADGLVEAPRGWNFVDWVPQWREMAGMPHGGEWGVSSVINWQFVLALEAQAQIEDALGETLLAQRNRETATYVAQQIMRFFWDEERELFADDLEHKYYSEHAQCLAILSGHLDVGMQNRIAPHLINDTDLARTTIYFSHYLFETLRVLERADVLFEKLEMWFELKNCGFVTTFESPEPSRSDCHAWGAHPLFHYFNTLLGIRPSSSGFRTVEIKPQFAHLTKLSGTVMHPQGEIAVDLERSGESLRGTVSLPHGVSGMLEWNGQKIALREGAQTVTL